MTIMEDLSLEEKLAILADGAKYDVACTSSGVERKGKQGMTGNTAACGICHSFSADGRCVSLLKILYTNECIYDCKYCVNRKSNDTIRTSFTPEEVCELTMQFYRRNYIEGLFLSSGIRNNPTRTREEIYSAKNFVPAGQSTQMIVGATPENDYQILSVAQALYRQFDLRRVFYSAYIALNDDSDLPAVGTKPPLLREHRLYQADWLMRFYGFEAGELLTEDRPNFNVYLDPKCEWALRHLELFPVEVNQASYAMLLRVPGIGVKSARRIVMARRTAKITFNGLKRIGVVLKRAHYFITCGGKMLYQTKIDEDYITRRILELDHKKNWELDYDITFRQLSLFQDMGMEDVS